MGLTARTIIIQIHVNFDLCWVYVFDRGSMFDHTITLVGNHFFFFTNFIF